MAIRKRYSKKNPKKYVWWVDFTPEGGERVRKSTGTKNRAKAQQLHDKLKDEAWDTNKLNVKPKRTWEESVVKYLKVRSHIKAYRSLVLNLRNLAPFLNGKYLHEINEDLIESFKDFRLSYTYQRRKGGKTYTIKKNTVNKDLQALSAVLNIAKNKWKWIDEIPKVELFELSIDEKERNAFLTHDEANILINELPYHLEMLVKFALSTGLRESNTTRLTWDKVNLKGRYATVDAVHSKNKNPMRIPLNDDAMEVLLAQQGKHKRFVFTYKGRPIKNANSTAWRKALDRAGICPHYPSESSDKGTKNMYPTKDIQEYKYESFRWHDLRHTWATWHAEAGTRSDVIQKLGAWKSAAMVKRYTHLSDDFADVFASNISLKNE